MIYFQPCPCGILLPAKATGCVQRVRGGGDFLDVGAARVCDAHMVTAMLPLCLSPGLVAFARCWSAYWLMAARGRESGEHPAVLSRAVMLGGCYSRALVGAAGEQGSIQMSPAGVSCLCPVSVPRPCRGDMMDSSSTPAWIQVLGA